MQHRLMQLSLCNYDFPRERFHSLDESVVAEKFSNREREREKEKTNVKR